MNGLLPIGKFVQLTGLSARMVRFYERLGMLRPAEVNPENGYRYYRYEQTLQAEKIRLLRSLEMPLEKINQLLKQPDPEGVRHRLAQHRQLIEDKIATYRQAIAALELLEQSEGTLYPIQVKRLEAQLYLSAVRDLKLFQVDQVRADTLKLLREAANEHGLKPAGPGFAVLGSGEHDPNTFEQGLQQPPAHSGTFRYEFGLPISKAVGPRKGLEVKRLPPLEVAAALHIGPYDPLHLAFRELTLWCHRHDRRHGVMLEVYAVGPLETADPDSYRTEVQYVLGGSGQ